MIDPIASVTASQDNNRSGLGSAQPAREVNRSLALPASDTVTTSEKDTQLSRDKVVSAVTELQRDMDALSKRGTAVQFQIDDELERVIVRVVDRDSKQVIRQLPPEEVLEMARMLREMREDKQAKGKNWQDERDLNSLEGLLLRGQA